MRDTQHLKAFAELTERVTHDVGDAAPDTGVYLVEDETRAFSPTIPPTVAPLPRLRAECLDREHHARQLAARYDPRERPEIFPGVRRQEKLRLVEAASGPLR